jgi:hypothetical protein
MEPHKRRPRTDRAVAPRKKKKKKKKNSALNLKCNRFVGFPEITLFS